MKTSGGSERVFQCIRVVRRKPEERARFRGIMSTPRLTAVTTALCLAVGATMWFSATTAPLRAMPPLQAPQPSLATQRPSARAKSLVVLNFTLPGGHQSQIRGPVGQMMRIWLRTAGRFGFVPTIRSTRLVVVTVYDLDDAGGRPLGEIDVVVGGAPVPVGMSRSFEIAIPRIVTPDFNASLAVGTFREQWGECDLTVPISQSTQDSDRCPRWRRDLEERRRHAQREMFLLAAPPN